MIRQSVIVLFFSTFIAWFSFPASANQGDKAKTRNPQNIDTLLIRAGQKLDGQYDSCIYFAELAYEYGVKTENRQVEAKASRLLADAYYYKDELNKAIGFYKISAEAVKNSAGEHSINYSNRLSDIGYCFYMLGLHDMAVNYYEQSLSVARRIDYKDGIYDNLSNLGTVYYHWGEYGKAIEAYQQTLAFDKQQNDPGNLSNSYNNIGKVYYVWGKYEEAIDHFLMALEYSEALKDTTKIAIRYGNLGMVYYKMGDLEKAFELLNDAIKLDMLKGNIRKTAVRQNELGKLLTSLKRYDEARNYLLQALHTFRDINALESESISLIDLGNLSLETNEPGDAENYFKMALELTARTNTLQIKMSAYRGLSEVYERSGETALALENFKLYSDHNRQMFNHESDKRIAAFGVKYETEKKEIENQLLKQENFAKSRNQVYLIIALAGLILLLLMLIYYLRLRNRNHKQLEKLATLEIDRKEQERKHLEDKVFAEKQINRLQKEKHSEILVHKNNQLANSTLSLVNKNEVLTDIKSRMIKLKTPDNGVEEIIGMINQNLDIDADWKKFRIDFDDAHPGFFDRLHSRYPDISETQEKLCAYLVINLTSKSIADLLHVSVAAVNKNRQRLRKKLDLQAEADLGEFLRNI
ncbi:MAG: tetratricopeptide repeat protein [Bacteroidales bacterium]|nr:tetratricopeptide repeat protein [Bacteroidales bacterium]